jgi:molybdopterin/thiamine biosynthesis adenylyltransferase
MRKFLKRKLFVKKTASHIIIGESELTLYKENSTFNSEFIERLIVDGVSIDEGKDIPLFQEFDTNGWLCDDFPILDRTGTFFESIKVDFQEELKDTRILIFGAGGAGGTLIYLLGQFGFTNLHVVDFDIVQPSDCRKTMVYRFSDIGLLKTAAIKKLLLENFGVSITTYDTQVQGVDDIEFLIREAQPTLIINAIDPHPIHKLHLNEAAFKANIPFLVIAYSYEFLFIGPFIIPGTTSCYESVRRMQMNGSEQRYDIREIQNSYGSYFVHPAISFVTNPVANVAVKEIIFYLTGRLDLVLTIGKILWFSMLDMSGTLIELECPPDCIVCGKE